MIIINTNTTDSVIVYEEKRKKKGLPLGKSQCIIK